MKTNGARRGPESQIKFIIVMAQAVFNMKETEPAHNWIGIYGRN